MKDIEVKYVLVKIIFFTAKEGETFWLDHETFFRFDFPQCTSAISLHRGGSQKLLIMVQTSTRFSFSDVGMCNDFLIIFFWVNDSLNEFKT